MGLLSKLAGTFKAKSDSQLEAEIGELAAKKRALAPRYRAVPVGHGCQRR